MRVEEEVGVCFQIGGRGRGHGGFLLQGFHQHQQTAVG